MLVEDNLLTGAGSQVSGETNVEQTELKSQKLQAVLASLASDAGMHHQSTAILFKHCLLLAFIWIGRSAQPISLI